MRDIEALVRDQTDNLKAKIEGGQKLRSARIAELLPTHERQQAEVDAKCVRCPRCGAMVTGLYPQSFLCSTCCDEFRAWDLARTPEEARTSFRWFCDLLTDLRPKKEATPS
jgi:hypothetical protein